jgi:hypothetical protein
VKQLTPCGKVPAEIRQKITEGQTPDWVPEKYKKAYNKVEKGSLELSDIECTDMVFTDAWLKNNILFVRVQRYTIINDLEIGVIPGIKKVWVKDGKLYYTYTEKDIWDRMKDWGIGGLVGGGLVLLILLP